MADGGLTYFRTDKSFLLLTYEESVKSPVDRRPDKEETYLHGDEVIGSESEELRCDIGDTQVADEVWVAQGELSSDWSGVSVWL